MDNFHGILPDDAALQSYSTTAQSSALLRSPPGLQRKQSTLTTLSRDLSVSQFERSFTGNNTSVGDIDYQQLANSTEYYSSIALTSNDTTRSSAASLCHYGAEFGAYHAMQQQQQQQQQHYQTKQQVSEIMSSSSSSNNYTPTSFLGTTNYGAADGLISESVLNLSTRANASTLSCHYSQSNGSASCYNRHRYMPYNHNRACATAAAQWNSSLSLSASMPFSMQQESSFAPFYQNYSDGIQNATNNNNNPLNNKSIVSINNLRKDDATTKANTTNYYNNSSNTTTADAALNQVNASNSSACSGSIASDISGMITSTPCNSTQSYYANTSINQTITLQITNLDYSMDESSLRSFLMSQLKPITPVISLQFEGNTYAKVTVPDLYFAKQVVANLHRKKIGHRRMLVSYTRDSSFTEINTLRCQAAGLLKDVPFNTLPMYKFRELFQTRFKTSISVLDLYKMQDICLIKSEQNEDKYISLQPDLVQSLETSPLMEGLHHSVPYCTLHFKREQHKGWAEQEIKPLPNVFMTVGDVQKMVYPLLKHHAGDIPIASLVHCIEAELQLEIQENENGVNLEHLVCCVQGIQVQMNSFGIKILAWLDQEQANGNGNANANNNNGRYNGINNTDPLHLISREVIELLKLSPKATMKFSRFIPAYHNHFRKQCRVADYGYTKLIELFDALATVVQIMGDGENRQITLTHRIQTRRFTSDLLRVLRTHNNKPVLLSELPTLFAQVHNRPFDITDYGVCDTGDILNGLINSNVVVGAMEPKTRDLLISISKRKQTNTELEKTSVFAGEMIELFSNAPQYAILFQKFVRSYHYHFGYQCRLSDYGFPKLADLMEALNGIVELDYNNDEDRKIYLSARVARRIFAEQCEKLIKNATETRCMPLEDVLDLHKRKYGYQVQPQTLGVSKIMEAIEQMPYVELMEKDTNVWITCHDTNNKFRSLCYRACKFLLLHAAGKKSKDENSKSNATKKVETYTKSSGKQEPLTLNDFIKEFNADNEEELSESTVKAMRHAIEIYTENNVHCVRITKFTGFLVKIVRIVELRRSVLIFELKSALDCNLTTTFEYGYPNIFAIVSAHPDLFVLHVHSVQELSEVSLTPNYELRHCPLAGLHQLFGPISRSYLKKKVPHNRSASLNEFNGRHSNAHANGPPNKTARILSSNDSCSNNANANRNNYNQAAKHHQQHNSSGHSNNGGKHHSLHSLSSSGFGSTNYSNISSGNQSSILNSTFYNNSSSSNKENVFNSSAHILNTSLNSSSNNSISELMNSSFGNIPPATGFHNHSFSMPMQPPPSLPPPPPPPPAATALMPLSMLCFNNAANITASDSLWDRRRYSTYSQQQQQQQQQHQYLQQYQQQFRSAANIYTGVPLMVRLSASAACSQPAQSQAAQPPPMARYMYAQSQQTPLQPPMLPTPVTSKNSKKTTNSRERPDLYDFFNNIKRRASLYEPPKPDTPPNDSMPFWIDPIWSNNHSSAEERSSDDDLNIRLPELKPMLPTVLSPYTLSKTENMKQQCFNFDSHDRKIA